MANEIIVSNNFLGIPNEEFEKQVKVWIKGLKRPFRNTNLEDYAKGSKEQLDAFQKADYGYIKGQKCLWKSGAIKLINMAGLVAKFTTQISNNNVAIDCILYKDGQPVATGSGGGSGQGDRDFNKGVQMAQKRALISAIRYGLNLDGTWTQDMEEEIFKQKDVVERISNAKLKEYAILFNSYEEARKQLIKDKIVALATTKKMPVNQVGKITSLLEFFTDKEVADIFTIEVNFD